LLCQDHLLLKKKTPKNKTKTKRPPKPPTRKTSKLYTNQKPQLSPKTIEIWGNFISPPTTPKKSRPPRRKRIKPIPPPRRTLKRNLNDNLDKSMDYTLPIKLPQGFNDALRNAVGKGSRKKRKRRRKKTKKAYKTLSKPTTRKKYHTNTKKK